MIPANYIAKWNGSAWSALGSGMNNGVLALAASGGVLYAGGGFTTAGGTPANYIAQWDGSAWSALGAGMDGFVYALAVDGGALYAGGQFYTAGGTPTSRIAQWDGSAWSALGSGMDDGIVKALAVSGGVLYAGGFFTTASGTPASRIAQWDGSAWSALGSGMNAEVYALAASGGVLYAGGAFTTAGGTSARYTAQWDGSAWSAHGSGMDGPVLALAASGGILYAGGQFYTAGGTSATNIAQWDGSAWSALGSGMDDFVNALAVSGANLYVGGDFLTAGDKFSPYAAYVRLPATVLSITCATAGCSTNAASVSWTVTFSAAVTGLSASHFALVPGGGVSGAAITGVTEASGTGTNATWTVTASTGTGDGTLGLNMVDATGVTPAIINLPFTGEIYTVTKPPATATVQSITRADPNPTAAASVNWTVTFSGAVAGLSASNFALVPGGGVTGAAISGASGSGTTWTVTAGTGTGDGTLRLDLTDASGITPPVTNVPPSFTGETYRIDKTPPTVVITRADPNPTAAASVNWTVTFSEAVTSPPTAGNFALAASGVSGATLTSVSGINPDCACVTVTAGTGSGSGTLGLNLVNSSGVTDAAGNPIGGLPTVGPAYTIRPAVTAITRADPDPTTAATVRWTVTFSVAVTGVDTTTFSNFALAATGVTGATIAGVTEASGTGANATWTVTAGTGTGTGTLRLDMADTSGITPTLTNVPPSVPLPFVGEAYTISQAIHGLAWSGEEFVAVGTGGLISTSLDGVTWIAQDAGTTQDLHAIVWSGQRFVAVGSGGVILTRDDGATWNDHTPTWTGTPPDLHGLVWSGSQFVAVGSSGTILTSPDGATWSVETVGTQDLYAVTWSGDRFVAVGAAGTVLAKANGSAWTAITPPPTTANLSGLAWSGSQFVAVGDSGTILTSPDGSTWTAITPPPTPHDLHGLAWSGYQFLAVGDGGTILASPDGATWTPLTPSPATADLFGVAWSGDRFVAVGGNSTTLALPRPWGDDQPLPGNRWTLLGLPAAPAAPGTVQSVFGARLAGAYGTDWVVYGRDAAADQYVKPAATDPVAPGIGYWLRQSSPNPADLAVAGTATPVVTGNPNCPSLAGCYEIPLSPPASGDSRYQLIGMPFPYPVGWWEARVDVDGVAYPLDDPRNIYVAPGYWVWNGNGYDSHDGATPGMAGTVQPWQGVWIKVHAASQGHAVTLLIPRIPKYGQTPPPAPPPSPAGGGFRALDWLLPAAVAAEPDPAWYVRLIAEEATQHLRDRNNVLGQLPDAAVGHDAHDLPELAPFGAPSLTVAFPHPDWGPQAGDYASDYRPSRDPQTAGLPPATWRFEVRADRAGYAVRLRWEGPPAVLERSTLLDEDTGARYPAADPALLRDGLPVAMTVPVRRFSWFFAGQPGP